MKQKNKYNFTFVYCNLVYFLYLLQLHGYTINIKLIVFACMIYHIKYIISYKKNKKKVYKINNIKIIGIFNICIALMLTVIPTIYILFYSDTTFDITSVYTLLISLILYCLYVKYNNYLISDIYDSKNYSKNG